MCRGKRVGPRGECLMKIKNKVIVLLFIITLMLRFACGKKEVAEEQNVNQTEEETTKEVLNYDLHEGVEMPNVVVETNKGNAFDLSKTNKPVLINFWATWCPPCRAEMPGLQNLYEEFGQKMDFVMIDCGETKETVQDFLIENEIYTFPIGYDTDNTYGFKFNITSIPTTCIVGKDKIINNFIIGMRTEEQYKEYIEKALKE